MHRHGGSPRWSCVHAQDELISLGWTPRIATAAVAAAAAMLGTAVALERLIREALRRCPRPTG
jgi:hypothetical protein